jgi:hypothetical protein
MALQFSFFGTMVRPMNTSFAHLLLGKDLRRLRNASSVIKIVQNQKEFDELFALLFHHERTLVMRTADAIEKITRRQKQFLKPHKAQLLSLMRGAVNHELQWHIAQLLPRLDLTPEEMKEVWGVLSYWALNPNESKIVRVNSLQALFDLSLEKKELQSSFNKTLRSLEREPIPSIQARIKKIKLTVSKSGN